MRLSIVYIVGILLSLTSCASLKKYERPQVVYDDLQYRLDYVPVDSQSVADYTWRAIFTDSLLVHYIEVAIDSNIDIRVALHNMEIAQAYLFQARGLREPTLSVAPSVNYQTSSLNTQIGRLIGERQHLTQYNIGIQAAWELDAWGKLKSQQRAVAAFYMQSISAHQAVQSDLVAEIAATYFQLAALDEQRAILESFIDYRTSFLETSRALKEAGINTEVAVKQAEAQLLNTQSQLIALNYDITVSENYFNRLLGRGPGEVPRTALSFLQMAELNDTGYPIRLLSNRPDVRAAEFGLVNALELSNSARAAFYPTINFSLNSGLQSIDLDKLFSLNSIFASVVGGLTQPILNKRSIRAQHQIRLQEEEIAYLNFRDALLNAVQEVSNAATAIKAQDAIKSIKESEYLAYALATEYSEDLVKSGLGNYLEVILANERTLSARLDFIQAELQLWLARIQLYRALGGGWE